MPLEGPADGTIHHDSPLRFTYVQYSRSHAWSVFGEGGCFCLSSRRGGTDGRQAFLFFLKHRADTPGQTIRRYDTVCLRRFLFMNYGGDILKIK